MRIVLHQAVVLKNFVGLSGKLVSGLVLGLDRTLGSLLTGEHCILFEASLSIRCLHHGLHRLAIRLSHGHA